MSATEVGVAYVRLLPSMEGFSGEVKSKLGAGLAGPAKQAGDDAGREMGKGIGDGVDGSHGKLGGAVSRLGDLFKVGLAAAGIAAGALLVTGIGGALENERIADKLEAQLGSDNLWAKSAGEIAGNLYKDGLGDGMADTAAAVKKVIQAGLSPELTDEALQGITAKFLTFSDVLEQDMDMAVQSVQSMFTSGLVSSAEEGLDVMTKAIQVGGDKAGDLAETFQEYSTNFRDAGLSAADAAGLMVQGLDAGARDADKVADAIKEFGIRAKDGSKASAEGYALIGLSAEEMTAKVAKGGPAAREALDEVLTGLRNMEDPVARNAAAVGLFGTQAEDLGEALFALDLDTAADNLGETAGATEGLGSAYDNAASKIEAFKRGALMAVTEFIGNEVIPKVEALGSVWTSFTDALSGAGGGADLSGLQGLAQDVGSFIYTLQTGMTADEGTGIEKVALAIRDALEQAQPVVDAFSTAWQSFTGFLEEHGEITTGIVAGLAVAIGAGLAVALASLVVSALAAAAPFILIGVAVAAVGAGIMWLWNNVEGFRNFVEEAAPAIGELFSSAFTLISTVIDETVSTIRTIWALWGDEFMSVAGAALSFVGSVITNGLNIISGIFKLVTALIKGDWSGAWDALKQIVTSNLAIIGSAISLAMTAARAVVSAAWSAITSMFGGQMTQIRTTVSSGLDAVVGFFRRLPGSVSSAMSTLANAITGPFRSAFNSLKSLWNSTVGGFSFSVPSWIPGVGGKGFSIPKMHTGGVFDPGPGATEGLALLKRGETVFTEDQTAALALGLNTPAPAAPTSVILRIDGNDHRFKEWLRNSVRVEGGGSVQRWAGQNA